MADARLLVVAIPDPLATRHLVQEARRQKPHLVIVARRHSEAEQRHLSTGGVDHAVIAERELAHTMAHLAGCAAAAWIRTCATAMTWCRGRSLWRSVRRGGRRE